MKVKKETKMTDKKLTVLRPNLKIKPSFAKRTIMTLKKDYIWWDSFNSEYLKEGACCVIDEL